MSTSQKTPEEIVETIYSCMRFGKTGQAIHHLSLATQQARDEERNSWINQKANAHDERIRKEERKRIREMIVNHESRDFGYCMGDIDCVDTWELVKDIEALSTSKEEKPKEFRGLICNTEPDYLM